MSGAAVKLEPGHVLDERYHLLKQIGRGGMGTVFSAKHLELGETVAVKVLQSESAFATMEAEHLERFLREARLASKIKNEHVVRILDVARGKNGSPPYIVMELLEGMDLGELSRGLGKVPIAESVDYILQACEALAEAHALGIVHRDLKSSNLHRTRHPDGTSTIKVLDFGISKAHDDTDVSLTSTSAVFGSPAYMSPEQIRSAKHVDWRTDIWALAIVLYELISGGELPFTGDSASAMLAAIAADPPIPLRKFQPECPFELDKAIYDALQKPREKRTQSVAAFAGALAPFGGPRAQEHLASVLRAAARASSRSGSLQPPPMPVPSSVQGTGPISDTMRLSDPAMQQPPPVSATEPLPSARRQDGFSGTDRDMVVPLLPRSSTTSVAAIVGIVGVGLGIVIGGGALLLLIRREPRHERREPPPSVVAVQAPEAGSIPAPVPAPPTSSAPIEPGAAPAVGPKKPKHVPHNNPAPTPVPSAKGNGVPDTSSRQ